MWLHPHTSLTAEIGRILLSVMKRSEITIFLFPGHPCGLVDERNEQLRFTNSGQVNNLFNFYNGNTRINTINED